MIVCTSCGEQNEDGESFCGNCGSYLEWDGQRVGAPEPVAAAPAPVPVADTPGFVARVKSAVGLGDRPADAEPSPSPAAPAPWGTPPGAVPSQPAGAPTTVPGAYLPPGAAPAAPAAPPPAGPAWGAPGGAAWGPPPAQPAGPPQRHPAGHPAGQPAGQPPARPAVPPPAATRPGPPPGTQRPANPGAASALVVPLGAAPADVPPAQLPGAVPAPAAAAAPAAAPAGMPGQPGEVAAPGSAPVAVRPGEAAPKPRRRDLPPEERPPAPGETICGSCGAGNAPARKFCRRCGAGLADMPVAGKPPWWRRLFSRDRAAPVAGTRPRAKPERSHGKLWTTLGVVAALVVAGYLTRPYWVPSANEVIDRVKGTAEVNPSAFSASTSAPGHPARFVRDGATNNFWAPAGRPAGQWVQADFASPFRLVYLRVFNGAADDLTTFLTEPSLQQISVTYLRKGAGPVTRQYTLQDKPGQQQLHVALDDVVGVRVTIRSVYRPASGRLAPLGELEFLARS